MKKLSSLGNTQLLTPKVEIPKTFYRVVTNTDRFSISNSDYFQFLCLLKFSSRVKAKPDRNTSPPFFKNSFPRLDEPLFNQGDRNGIITGTLLWSHVSWSGRLETKSRCGEVGAAFALCPQSSLARVAEEGAAHGDVGSHDSLAYSDWAIRPRKPPRIIAVHESL